MFKELKIRNKLYIGFLLLAFISMCIGLSGYLGLKKTIDQETNLVNNQVKRVAYLQGIKGALTRVALGERGLLIPEMKTGKVRLEQYESINAGIKDSEAFIADFEKIARNTETDTLWKEFLSIKDAWLANAQMVVQAAKERDRLIAAGKTDKDPDVLYTDGMTFDASVTSRESGLENDIRLNNLIKLENDATNAEFLNNVHQSKKSTLLDVIFIITGFIMAIGFGYFISSNIKNIINSIITQINDVVDSVIRGKWDARTNVMETNFEFREISTGFNNIIDSLVGFMDVLPSPVMVIDNEFTIQYMNEAGARLDGKSGKQLTGAKCYNHFKTNDCQTANCACAKTMNSGRNEQSETSAAPGSNKLEIAYSAVPVKDNEGKTIGAFEVVTDQTAIKTALKKIEKVNDYQARESVKLTNGLKNLAIGDLNINLSVASADSDTLETSKMFEEINSAVKATVQANNEIIAKAKQVAAGDLTVSLDKRSENDELMESLTKMVKSTAKVITEFQTAAENISSSRPADELDSPGNESGCNRTGFICRGSIFFNGTDVSEYYPEHGKCTTDPENSA